MNSIKVWGINKECDTYDISIETSESVSPAMLHTTARLMEGLGCTVSITSASTTKEQTMSSEKPFWKGKTLMEIQNLDQRVKVTMENGDVFIGKLIRRSRDTDGICHLSMQLDAHRTYLHVFSAESSDTPPVIPSYVDTIELVDDPEYERIDNIENVQVGDIACTTEGNHFPVIDLKPDPLGDMLLRIRISEIDGEYCIDSDDFAYALRRKPKLPDHDGLWWDKDNALWSVAISGLDNSKLVALLIGDPESPVTGSVWSGLNSKHVTSQAPFRPVKAVEA